MPNFHCSPAGRLVEYLACLDKIQKAVEYFQDNNPDSPELNRVVRSTLADPGRLYGYMLGCQLPTCQLLAKGDTLAACL